MTPPIVRRQGSQRPKFATAGSQRIYQLASRFQQRSHALPVWLALLSPCVAVHPTAPASARPQKRGGENACRRSTVCRLEVCIRRGTQARSNGVKKICVKIQNYRRQLRLAVRSKGSGRGVVIPTLRREGAAASAPARHRRKS
jgi:hypothetical protein